MADPEVTYTSSVPKIEGKPFVCKRCQRVYAQPHTDDRPIRCECGWWYYNNGVSIREVFWPRLAPYRMPGELARFFGPTDIFG
ncbi:MAG: hypothetical protein ACYDA1_03055 [Vulcanimicrobiaceae bacterium]